MRWRWPYQAHMRSDAARARAEATPEATVIDPFLSDEQLRKKMVSLNEYISKPYAYPAELISAAKSQHDEIREYLLTRPTDAMTVTVRYAGTTTR
jgi:hypothetical protein